MSKINFVREKYYELMLKSSKAINSEEILDFYKASGISYPDNKPLIM